MLKLGFNTDAAVLLWAPSFNHQSWLLQSHSSALAFYPSGTTRRPIMLPQSGARRRGGALAKKPWWVGPLLKDKGIKTDCCSPADASVCLTLRPCLTRNISLSAELPQHGDESRRSCWRSERGVTPQNLQAASAFKTRARTIIHFYLMRREIKGLKITKSPELEWSGVLHLKIITIEPRFLNDRSVWNEDQTERKISSNLFIFILLNTIRGSVHLQVIFSSRAQRSPSLYSNLHLLTTSSFGFSVDLSVCR